MITIITTMIITMIMRTGMIIATAHPHDHHHPHPHDRGHRHDHD